MVSTSEVHFMTAGSPNHSNGRKNETARFNPILLLLHLSSLLGSPVVPPSLRICFCQSSFELHLQLQKGFPGAAANRPSNSYAFISNGMAS